MRKDIEMTAEQKARDMLERIRDFCSAEAIRAMKEEVK